MQFHKQIDFKNTKHQAGIFFAQLAIHSPHSYFLQSVNTVGCSMVELNVSIIWVPTYTFNSPAVQLL